MSPQTYSWIGLFVMLFSVVLGVTGKIDWGDVGLIWLAVFAGSILLGIIRGLILRKRLDAKYKEE